MAIEVPGVDDLNVVGVGALPGEAELPLFEAACLSSVVSRRNALHRRSVQDKVKQTVARRATLDDPSGLFNASRDDNTRRAIDFREGGDTDGGSIRRTRPVGCASQRVPSRTTGSAR